jgi:hypothetical protein
VTSRNGQIALSPGQGSTVLGTVHLPMVEGARVSKLAALAPLHRTSCGPPPRSGEAFVLAPRLRLSAAQVLAERFGEALPSFVFGLAHRAALGLPGAGPQPALTRKPGAAIAPLPRKW